MTTLQTVTASQANKETPFGENFESLSAGAIFSKRQPACSGLTWGFYGGLYNGNTIADGTVTLTNAADNYVVVLRSTGVVSTSTSSANSLNSLYAKLYKVTTAGGLATTVVDQRWDANGLLFNTSGASGTVTSVAASVPAFLSVAGSPVTSSGTLAISYSGTALPVENGGTGATSLTAYAPVFGGTTGTGAVQSGTAGTAGQVLTSNGAGVLPTFQAAPSGSVATDTIWDAAGDLVQGTGANTAAKLSIGGAGKSLHVNAGATGLQYESAPKMAHTQAAQSGNYLDRRGQWCDPLVVGTGAMTVGAITTLFNTSRYLAWPVACRLRNGKVLLGYTDGDSHHGSTDGTGVGAIATESPDGTLTFGAQFTIYNDASQWVSVYGVSQVSTGRIFATMWKDSGSGSTDIRALVTYSDDDGATWLASPVSLHAASGFTRGSLCGGPVVELSNGTLAVPIEGYNTAETGVNADTKILFSTDNGVTWGGLVAVTTGSGTPRFYAEPKLALLDDGSLLCAMRTTELSGTLYLSKSTDNGATWGAPYAGPGGYGAPSFIQLSTRTLVLTTRQNATGDVIAFTSVDRGVTWSAGTVLDAAPYEMEYACPLELLNSRGKFVVFYGDQPTVSLTNSDIKQVLVTEAGSSNPTEHIIIACSDETTALTTGTSKVTFRMPYAFTLTQIPRGSNTTAATGGTLLTVDINEAGASILSTKLTFDASEKTTTTAATPAVLSDTSLADDAEMTIDIDAVGSTITGAGLKVTLIGRRT